MSPLVRPAGGTTSGTLDLFDVPVGHLLRAAHEAIVMVDESQTVVAMNPAAQQLLGCTIAQALGQPLSQLIPDRHAGEHSALVRHFMTADGSDRPMAGQRHVTARRADGQEVPVEITLSSIEVIDATGTRRYYAALLRDLSEVELLQHELDAVRRRLRAMFELAPIAIWIADNERVVFANSAAGALFGKAGGAPLVGMSVFELLHADSHAELSRQLALALAGEPGIAAVSGRLAGGDVREVEIALAALPDHGQTTVQMVVTDVTQRRLEAASLEHSRHELRQLSASVIEAREAERRRIARELHDELGQRLTALKMDLSSLGKTADLGPGRQRVDGMLAMLDETVASLRRIAADLRPLMLDDLGLNAAIEWLAQASSRRLGIAVEVDLDNTSPPLDGRLSITLYRVVQEALTNVARHSHATAAHIELRHDGNEIVLTVRDNGAGFPARSLQREGSFGLLGIRERAHLLGGRLEIGNNPAGGGRLSVHLPLAQPNVAT